MPESVQSCYELSLFSNSSRLARYTDIFFFVKILFLVRKISNLCEATFHENYLTSDFPIQTLLFQACLPTRQNGVENRDTVFISVIPA